MPRPRLTRAQSYPWIAPVDAAKVAQEQSTHLHLCYLIHDLTQQYGAVIRPAKVVGVLDSAFDVVVVCRWACRAR